MPFNAEQLAAILADAKKAHTAFEAEHGPDADWTVWYAEYILARVEALCPVAAR